MIFDLVISGGKLVTASTTYTSDIGINGETIAAIGEGLQGKEVIDARGKLVIPGAIDPHVHLEMPVGDTFSADDWASGTLAAACGGVTTVIDFVEPEPDEVLIAALQKRLESAQGKAVIDYGLHMTLRYDHPDTLNQIPAVVAEGCPSFKTYLTYEGFALSDKAFLNVLEAVGKARGMVLVHAENDAIVSYCTRQMIEKGKTSPGAHALARPAIAEMAAIQNSLAHAEVTGTPLYIVHISTAGGTSALEAAHLRGITAYGETCPQYLTLTEDKYDLPNFEGAKYVCSPPLRQKNDQETLWRGLAKGVLQTVGSDHCPFNFNGQKDKGRDSFVNIPPGLPGIEIRLALLFTFGVKKGHISINRWVDCCASSPARLFGLYPRKGHLIPGADADIVIFDPDKEIVVTKAVLHERVDYTPYEGIKLQGYPVMTILRGKSLVIENEYIGTAAHGQFLKRQVYQ